MISYCYFFSMPSKQHPKEVQCGYDPSTMRCVKHTNFPDFSNSSLCKYNKETQMCVKKRPKYNACSRDKLIIDGRILESSCPQKCLVKGLGTTTVSFLNQKFSLPKRWDMNYGVLDNGECIVVNKYGVIREIRYVNNRVLVNFGNYEATVIPNK